MSKAFKAVASIAAPIVGGVLGGPAGAIAGAAVGGALTASQAASQQRAGAADAARLSAQSAATGRGDIRQALPQTLAELSQGAGAAQRQLQPIADVGGGAFDIQAAISGALGPEAQAQAFQNFQQSPEQAFLQEEAEQASLRNAAATGGLGGGRIQQELQRQAIGFGARDIQSRFSRLGTIAGQGIEARTNLANLQSSLGSARASAQQTAGAGLANIAVGQAAPQANLALAQANARAAGTLGVGSAIQQGVGQLAQQGFFSPQQTQPQQGFGALSSFQASRL
jgi:hypothetical protein